MNIVAIIPARGGSKRIPNKNIRLFAGQPIISYSIKAAQAADLFDSIIVSTDSEEIAEVAKTCGAEVPFIRPAELADDFTSTSQVLLHALNWSNEHNSAADRVGSGIIPGEASFILVHHVVVAGDGIVFGVK